jgi:hypothetical protein
MVGLTTWADAERASTLEDAKTVLPRLAPAPDAPPPARRAYHLRAAALYRRVATTDGRHHFEALGYADVENNYAEKAT